jgi:prolyl oligopeptidase
MPTMAKLETLKATPAALQRRQPRVEQFEATSKDGTKIPISSSPPQHAQRRHHARLCSTLMAVSRSARCLPIAARWARCGWSRAMPMSWRTCAAAASSGRIGTRRRSGENKQRTWDDYIAVAEDLIRRRVTSPRHLGVVGGSQGGSGRAPPSPSARAVQRSDHPGAVVRHAALPPDGRRRRVVDR